MKKEQLRLSCRGCVHFFITYDPHRPWGCRNFGFKGKNLPAATVYESTGMQCAYFEQNPSFRRAQSQKNSGQNRSGRNGRLDMKG